MSKVYADAEKFFERSKKISQAYGFIPLHEVIEERKGTSHTNIPAAKHISNKHLQNLSQIIRFYFERHVPNEVNPPLLLFHSNIENQNRRALSASKKAEEVSITLTTIGIKDSYAEALLTSCVSHIFKECNAKNHTIRINSMGSTKDAQLYYEQLKQTLKKVKRYISPECKKIMDRDGIVEAHQHIYDNEQHGVFENLTPTIRLLSDSALLHFQTLIEHFETQGLTYELAPELVENIKYGEHSVIEVQDNDSRMYAKGGRYDPLSHHLYKRSVPSASITITLPEKTDGSYISNSRPKKPKLFFLHSGKLARLHSIQLMEKIASINIPIAHRMHYTTVLEQLDGLEQDYPYMLIFGQEEAENNTIRLKNTETQAFKIIPIDELANIKMYIR